MYLYRIKKKQILAIGRYLLLLRKYSLSVEWKNAITSLARAVMAII